MFVQTCAQCFVEEWGFLCKRLGKRLTVLRHICKVMTFETNSRKIMNKLHKLHFKPVYTVNKHVHFNGLLDQYLIQFFSHKIKNLDVYLYSYVRFESISISSFYIYMLFIDRELRVQHKISGIPFILLLSYAQVTHNNNTYKTYQNKQHNNTKRQLLLRLTKGNVAVCAR